MRRVGVACMLAWAMSLATGGAAAQSEPQTAARRPGKYKAQPLNMRREKLGSEGLGDVARTRVKNGDCAGAIDVFDEAIRTSTEPALRRDRGLCHESLGHPYPAIDDYRAYLTAQPDARDADNIRERLASLEQSTLGYSSASTDTPAEVQGGVSSTASVRVGSEKASGSTTPTSGARVP